LFRTANQRKTYTWLGPRFLDVPPWLKGDRPIKENPICWSWWENSGALKSPIVWVFSCGQQEILYHVPQLKIFNQPNHWQTATSLGQRYSWLASATGLLKKFRGTAEHIGCNVPDVASKKPHVCPEKGIISIAHMGDQGNSKECHRHD
jgi:hypothetical protein